MNTFIFLFNCIRLTGRPFLFFKGADKMVEVTPTLSEVGVRKL